MPDKKTDYAAEMQVATKKHDKKAYYTAQRKRAIKTGDTKMLSKIEGKLPDSKKDWGYEKNPATKPVDKPKAIGSVKAEGKNVYGYDPVKSSANAKARKKQSDDADKRMWDFAKSIPKAGMKYLNKPREPGEPGYKKDVGGFQYADPVTKRKDYKP